MTNLKNLILKYLPYDPTQDQLSAIDKIQLFLQQPQKAVFILTGFAGTGKTSLIAALVKALKELNTKTILMAPTGRAANVLKNQAKKHASTIHRQIYKRINKQDPLSDFVLAKNPYNNTLFIVDEASMISNYKTQNIKFGSGYLLQDLISFVFSAKNTKLLILGDTAQLPPVNQSISPALQPDFFKSFGLLTFSANLSQVIRQNKNSGILYNATLIRNLINKNKPQIPKINTDFPDIQIINGNDVTEIIENSYSNVGIDQTLVITRSNKMANIYNSGIRSYILQKENILAPDDRIMIVKNNYFWLQNLIANGDTAIVNSIHSFTNAFDLQFAKITAFFPDYNTELDTIVILDTLTSNNPSLTQDEHKIFFNKIREKYANLKNYKAIAKAISKDQFFNALQIKFAYAVTCHKAQGGQWKHVIIDFNFFVQPSIEFLRWFYTAITRATEKVFLVNYPQE